MKFQIHSLSQHWKQNISDITYSKLKKDSVAEIGNDITLSVH